MPPITSKKEKLLFIGWSVGPFLVAFLVLAFVSIIGWPSLQYLGLAIPLLPVIVGLVCFVTQIRPKGLQCLVVIPYSAGYLLMVLYASVVIAVILGAPK